MSFILSISFCCALGLLVELTMLTPSSVKSRCASSVALVIRSVTTGLFQILDIDFVVSMFCNAVQASHFIQIWLLSASSLSLGRFFAVFNSAFLGSEIGREFTLMTLPSESSSPVECLRFLSEAVAGGCT